jgi:type III secretory pathway component EscT
VGDLTSSTSVWGVLSELTSRLGVSWQQVLLAWARVLPLVTIVPAFGSRLMPAPARAVFGLGLAALLMPAVAYRVPTRADLVFGFARELFRGLPVALATGALLWAAMMAGGLIDDLRGASQQQSNILPDARTPLSALLGLFATCAFLELGGVESATASLVNDSGVAHPLVGAVRELVGALHITFALCAPILCVSVVWEVASALIARAASPAHVQSLLAPLRALVVLGAFAVVLPAFFELLQRVLATHVR